MRPAEATAPLIARSPITQRRRVADMSWEEAMAQLAEVQRDFLSTAMLLGSNDYIRMATM